MPTTLIDPRTVLLLTAFVSSLMALVHYGIRRSYPASVRVPREWTASMLIFIGGCFLAASAGQLPPILSIALANLMLWLALYTAYVGSQRFFSVKPNLTGWASALLVAFVWNAWFTWVTPDYTMRSRVATLMMAALCGAHARLVFQQGINSFARRAAFLTLVFSTGNQLVRAAYTFGPSPLASILDNALYHQIYLGSCTLGLLLTTICALLMASERMAEELRHRAAHDPLTGALTRRHMDELCRAELDRARRNGHGVALLMMDLDHFKRINDTHGHQAGDDALVKFAQDTRELLRPSDALGRFGGEEFLALLPDTGLSQAQRVAERIRARCTQAGNTTACTVSIGLAISETATGTVNDLLKRADAALYRAKALGRDRVEVG